MIYCFWLILTTIAFWIVRMSTRSRAVRRRLPGRPLAGLDLPELAADLGLTFLVPIAFAVTVPAEAFTQRLTAGMLGLAVLFAVGLLLVTRWFWRLRPPALLGRLRLTRAAA